jgi:hypothetical protein
MRKSALQYGVSAGQKHDHAFRDEDLNWVYVIDGLQFTRAEAENHLSNHRMPGSLGRDYLAMIESEDRMCRRSSITDEKREKPEHVMIGSSRKRLGYVKFQ